MCTNLVTYSTPFSGTSIEFLYLSSAGWIAVYDESNSTVSSIVEKQTAGAAYNLDHMVGTTDSEQCFRTWLGANGFIIPAGV